MFTSGKNIRDGEGGETSNSTEQQAFWEHIARKRHQKLYLARDEKATRASL